MDASTGIAIGSRKGLGKVKHVDTVYLWCQDKVASGAVVLTKRHTSEMVADMMTKQLDIITVIKHLDSMGYRFEDGRHRLALKV